MNHYGRYAWYQSIAGLPQWGGYVFADGVVLCAGRHRLTLRWRP